MLAGRGYEVVAVTGKASEEAYLKDIGARSILVRDNIDFGKRPMEKALWAGAIDNLGGDYLAWLIRTMGYGGNIASIGLAASFKLDTTVMPFILRAVTLAGIDSATILADLDVDTGSTADFVTNVLGLTPATGSPVPDASNEAVHLQTNVADVDIFTGPADDAIVLDDGRTRLAIVIVDSCMMPRALLDEEHARELPRGTRIGSRPWWLGLAAAAMLFFAGSLRVPAANWSSPGRVCRVPATPSHLPKGVLMPAPMQP